VRSSEPVEHGLPGYGWTLNKVRRWVKQVFQCEVSRNVLRRILKQGRLSWKQCEKVLKKAKPAQRAAYIEQFQALFEQVCQEEIRLIYVDEAHFHRDLDLGYTWAPVGQPAWRLSDCASLAQRINWYGAYDFSNGRCLLWQDGCCNTEQTICFLTQLAAWVGPTTRAVVIVWDGAPWHKSRRVQEMAATLGLTLRPLPAYSPDLNPIEGLWKWMRKEVTQLHSYDTLGALFDACMAFIDRINADPLHIISRLWPKFELDQAYEKLLVST
jgi:hypothetical protein